MNEGTLFTALSGIKEAYERVADDDVDGGGDDEKIRAIESGSVELEIQREADVVVVTAFAAKGLKDMDAFGANDVFLSVTLNDSRARQTSVIEGGGANCEWGNNGQGERLVFKKFVGSIESIGIFCFDDDGSEGCARLR